MDGERTRSGDRGGFLSFRLVMGVFTLLLVFGLSLGVFIHRRYVAFDRVAARHVPEGAALVVRWEVEKVTLFEPTRRHLLPLLDGPRAASRAKETRRERLEREADLNVGRDLGEVVVVLGPRPQDWAIVLGGSFPDADVVGALERALRAEGRTVRRLGPERLTAPGGISFGRASDGALVIASSPAELDAVLPVRAPHPAIGRKGAASLLVRADAPGLPPRARELLAELGSVSGVVGHAEPGSPLTIEFDVDYRDEPPSDALARAERILGVLFGPVPKPAVEVVPGTAPGRLRFRIRLNDDALGRAAGRAADAAVESLWERAGRLAVPDSEPAR